MSVTPGQCDARPTFPATRHHRPLAGTVPNYTAWWHRHMCVNNLRRVAFDSERLWFEAATC